MEASPSLVRGADFGPLVVETDVDKAVIDTLRLWMPTYLAQVERERGYANKYLKRPVQSSYANTLESEEFLDHSLPAIIVTTAETEADPGRTGNGAYYAEWLVVVTAISRGRRPPETRELVALYGGSIRRVLVQQQSLGGFAGEVRWRKGNVAAVQDTTGSGRYLAAAINTFYVYVEDVVREGVGPYEPSEIYEADPTDPDTPYEELVDVGVIDTNEFPERSQQ